MLVRAVEAVQAVNKISDVSCGRLRRLCLRWLLHRRGHLHHRGLLVPREKLQV